MLEKKKRLKDSEGMYRTAKSFCMVTFFLIAMKLSDFERISLNTVKNLYGYYKNEICYHNVKFVTTVFRMEKLKVLD